MVIDRRSILISLLAGAFAPRLAVAGARQLYVSCRLDGTGAAAVSCFDSAGAELFSTALPSRGHDLVQRPGSNEVAVFARRPGNWMLVADVASGTVITSVAPAVDRRFCGHGVYTADGHLLLVTENNESSFEGIIGIYDAADGYRRVGEFLSGGVGPHDITLCPDGTTAVIANGGLRTDAVTGRDMLVEGDAPPGLVRADIASGKIRDRFGLPSGLRKLSIRHLAAREDGTIAFGCQHQGSAEDMPPLAGLLSPGGRLTLLESPEEELARMKNYVGSVSFNRDGSLLAATSPHGNQVMLWSGADGRFVTSIAKTDVCGVAPLDDGFIASSGNSGIEPLGVSGGKPVLLGFIWDNHLLRLTA